MQNRKLVILIILSIGAAVSLIYGIAAPPRIKMETAKAADIQEKTLLTTEKTIISADTRPRRSNYSSWGRNPFIPSAVKTPGEFNLSGIIWDKGEPKALINDVVVGMGDKIDGCTVVDINEDSVILNDGTKDIILELV